MVWNGPSTPGVCLGTLGLYQAHQPPEDDIPATCSRHSSVKLGGPTMMGNTVSNEEHAARETRASCTL